MTEDVFRQLFAALTGNEKGHFPWQWDLYDSWFRHGRIPASCNLPTGLGKTSVIAVWLIALANGANVPRRLVYVVNRRTVVDQTTNEVEKYLKAEVPGLPKFAISTLRGQFADNREWSADPSRPAVICGTVDMIGSRLLFSGYGVGFKSKPLHAGFLGQNALIVHDEAHLEPAFQELLLAIEKEQKHDFHPLKVMELTATSRSSGTPFKLSPLDDANPEVDRRINAGKILAFHTVSDEKKQLAEKLLALSLTHKESGKAILVFVRTIETLQTVVAGLTKAKCEVQQLTGTLRGLERNRMADPHDERGCPIFARFLPPPKPTDEPWKITPKSGTVYLVCTSAGEVGVNISADHLVCDLSPFDSMAQRFGRVNRFGLCSDTRIDVVHPDDFDDEEINVRRQRTLALLKSETLNGIASPAALGKLDADARNAAFTPTPTILPVTDILFDAWALTSIRGKLPGRPMVEPYLHGVADSEIPETQVAWREEVERLTEELREIYEPAELLEVYPIKPHELLKEPSYRAMKRFEDLAERRPDDFVWIVDDDGSVQVVSLKVLTDSNNKKRTERIERKTVLLSPASGGLTSGLLDGKSANADDVSELPTRCRTWDDDPIPEKMACIYEIDTKPEEDEDATDQRYWFWWEEPREGEKANTDPVTLKAHVQDVVDHATAIVSGLPLDESMKQAIILAAKLHDLGKRRAVFQKVLGNFSNTGPLLAKSGKGNRFNKLKEDYRHEFGSLTDLETVDEFKNSPEELKDLVRHHIAVHHGLGRPHFPKPYDPDHADTTAIAAEVPRRFARLQRQYGRWGLAYLESLLRAADWAASANPSPDGFVKESS